MAVDFTLLIGCLVFILGSCILFSNAVEWLGKIYNLGHGVVGSIFAAVGTALPETLIPLIAILFHPGAEATNIGIGAIAGAPFMLGTLAFFITGTAIIIYTLSGRRTLTMNADPKVVAKDLTYFIIFYSLALAATLWHGYLPGRIITAVLLLGGYGLYITHVFRSDTESAEEPGDLFFHRFLKTFNLKLDVYLQLFIGLAGIILGAHYFIIYIERLSPLLGITPLVLSIIITPIATELPEKLNSVIWTGRQKDTLALGNITGAMVFQSCIPVTVGLLFTPWKLDKVAIISAIIALSSALVYLMTLKLTRKLNPFLLLCGGVGYITFLLYIFLPH